jgi:anti-sigma B factor antagonist
MPALLPVEAKSGGADMRTPDKPHATVKPLLIPEIAQLPEEIDLTNAPRIGRDLADTFRRGIRVVIADMSLTEFCDSSGLRHLVIADAAARRAGGELRLVVRAPLVLRAMQVVGVDQVLHIYGSLEDAMSGKPDIIES